QILSPSPLLPLSLSNTIGNLDATQLMCNFTLNWYCGVGVPPALNMQFKCVTAYLDRPTDRTWFPYHTY
ncbi:hypothetical protein QUB70_32015, partial [Microcoleus sp. A003_D6]|uniref:hypothetical protein n=1 Tax=Microcoleus sp. A003_D6 TaxID=3055266 RepID=UPI002FCFF849